MSQKVQILLPGAPDDPAYGYGMQREVFDQVSDGRRPPTLSVTPSTRHVGVTKKDTHRPGFEESVRSANRLGFPVLVRGAGGGATAADYGTFGFSLVRPSDPEDSRGKIRERYDEAASLVLGAFGRLGIEADIGEVRDEFCPGDHSIRIGGWQDGMKIVGIAQRLTSRATSVGGIVLVDGHDGLAEVLEGVYGAMDLPFRKDSVGSLTKAGHGVEVADVISALVEEAGARYETEPGEVGEETRRVAGIIGGEQLVRLNGS